MKTSAKETKGSASNPQDEELLALVETTEYEAIKPLKNEEMTTNKGPLSEVSIERMVRTIEVDKGNEKVDSFAKDVCMSNEVWMKVISIEDKIDAITRMLGKVAATVQMIDLAQNLFYAYVKTWHKYALVAMRRVVTVSLPEGPSEIYKSPENVSEAENTLKEEALSKIIKDCLFDLNLTTKAVETPTFQEKEDVTMEDVDENEEKSSHVEKIDSEEVVAEDKSVASKVVDATCVGPELVRDTTRLAEVVSSMDEQEDNHLDMVVYKAPPQFILTSVMTDHADNDESLR
ncbi:hypothetical protein V6N13_007954 [Hibiscus sabdariffa]